MGDVGLVAHFYHVSIGGKKTDNVEQWIKKR
jgi:hypothetical protein